MFFRRALSTVLAPAVELAGLVADAADTLTAPMQDLLDLGGDDQPAEATA